MPELPEVETIVRGLNKFVLGRKIEGVWSDWEKTVKKPSFSVFEKEIGGKVINRVTRRGKNIIFDLSGDKILLAHQKMTGHFIVGQWEQNRGLWESTIPGALREDNMNNFLHFMFFLDNGWQLALSDVRKFAKMELWDKDEFSSQEVLSNLGPEPLDENLTFTNFKNALFGKINSKIKNKQLIKKTLLDQNRIAGIGNIYADEILWASKIHPEANLFDLKDSDLREIFKQARKILKRAIELEGTSISDFRNIAGERGSFGKMLCAYKRGGQPCSRCGSVMKRIVVAQRGTCFCPTCQK